MVLLHTRLGHADVVYAEKFRRIAPLEQLVHGFLSVLPVSALGIVAAMHWPDITTLPWTLRLDESPSVRRGAVVFIGSYVLLAGLPNLEEYLRAAGRLRREAEFVNRGKSTPLFRKSKETSWNALKKPLK